jgi:hypothetical protein
MMTNRRYQDTRFGRFSGPCVCFWSQLMVLACMASSSSLCAPPLQLTVLTCMDSRLIPERFLGLDIGDAEIIRNGGGRVTLDVLR